jgi:hypothetical protein
MHRKHISLSINMHSVVLWLWVFGPAHAADWYVAADVPDEGTGTIQASWTLRTALEGGRSKSRVRPGDTIWVRGGTYRGTFTCYFAGESGKPILLRNYRDERVTLDAQGTGSSGLSVTAHSPHVWIWGLEFTNSDRSRVAKTRSERLRWNLVDLRGPECKLINCILHDGACGIGVWQEARNAEVYGCLTYQNGWHRPDGDGGYGIYCQNHEQPDAPSRLQIRDSLCWNNYSFGLHGYAEEGHVENIVLDGLAGFNNGSPDAAFLHRNKRECNVIVAPLQPSRRIEIRNCCFYQPSGSAGTCLSFGTTTVDHHDLTLLNNYIVGPQCLTVAGWKTVEISGNSFVARPATPLAGALVTLKLRGGGALDRYAWDRNTYFDASGAIGEAKTPFSFPDPSAEDGRAALNYETWRTRSGLDQASRFSLGLPAVNHIVVLPNRYEKGRAHVVIYNWQGLSTVRVDLGRTGLSDGQNFQIRNAEDFFGKPRYQGTYRVANPTVDVDLQAHDIPPPIGDEDLRIVSTLPEFAALVVIPGPAAAVR